MQSYKKKSKLKNPCRNSNFLSFLLLLLSIKIINFAYMIERKNIIYLLLIITILANCHYVFAETIEYKSNGCNLIYNKIDEYNVEVGKQKNNLNYEKIYIPSEINVNDTMYYVIGITENAFSGNKHIKKVLFDAANDIQYIGDGAFSGCENLTDIELPSTISEIKPYTFAWCGLKYIEIHNFITKIGERAFTNCKKLSKIEMSENVEEIGNYAFAWCTSLTAFTIPEKTQKLGYEILQANTNLDTLFFNAINCEISGAYYDDRIERTIGAFEGNKGLSEVIFGYRVERIPEYLLYNCHNVDSLYFPKSIKDIDRFALHNTEWYRGTKKDLVYVNNILYSYKGSATEIGDTLFKENTNRVSSYCFYNNDKLKTIKLPSSITSIGESAFEGCKELKSIILPYELEELKDRAFKDCKNLKNIQFNLFLEHIGKYCFAGCHELRKIILPTSIKKMGEGTFYNCSGLQQINIPDSLTTIVAGCFSKCPSLERVVLHKNITKVEEYAFAGCTRLDSIEIPWKCEVIGSRAFSHCEELNYININAKSIRIDPLAFYKCENLYYIDLIGAHRIGRKAFADCTNLQNITLGKDLSYISDYAFENCKSLYSIKIPQNVTYIGKYAFSRCQELGILEIDNAKTNIGAHAFDGCISMYEANLGYNITEIGIYAFNRCKSLEKIEIKHPLEEISTKCFAQCNSLTTIELPQGLKKIGAKAFYGCNNLTEIILPNTINDIEEQAFSYCSNIENINLPNEITHIGQKAFWQCENLQAIQIPETLEILGEDAFGNCNNLTQIIFNAEKCKTNKPAFGHTTKTKNLKIGNNVQIIDNRIFEGINIDKIEIPQNVSEIRAKAFANSTLNDVKLLSSNIEIDNTAFDNTNWLKKQNKEIIYIDQVAFKFTGENLPTELTIKDGTTAIAANFMKGNINLKKINLPSSLEVIGSAAFENCTNLSSITLPPYITNINKYAFANCHELKYINLSSYLISIGDFAFENCTNIDSITINQAYCSIGIGAFRNCNKMTKATIGDKITSIGNMAFAYCTNLKGINADKKIILPSELEIINNATFYNCEKLSGKIVIPRNVTTIKDQAFEGCRGIHSVEISTKLDTISTSAFDRTHNFTRFFSSSSDHYTIHQGLLYSKNISVLYHCPKGYKGTCVVHRDTRVINNKAFNNCSNIQNIISNGIEEIKDFAFNGCTKLKRVTLGENFRNFNYQIFQGCQSLMSIDIKKDNRHYKSIDGILYTADMKTLVYCPQGKNGIVKIPKSVRYIADYAFYNCNQIEKVIIHKNIKTIGKEAFTGCNTQQL